MPAFAGQEPRQLGARRRLARALQSQQQDDPRRDRRGRETALRIAEEGQHLVADDANDLLIGREALQDVGVDGAIADAIGERLDHLEVDVGLEQRHADLAQGDLHRFRREASLTADLAENVLKALAERFEHRRAGTRGVNCHVCKRLS